MVAWAGPAAARTVLAVAVGMWLCPLGDGGMRTHGAGIDMDLGRAGHSSAVGASWESKSVRAACQAQVVDVTLIAEGQGLGEGGEEEMYCRHRWRGSARIVAPELALVLRGGGPDSEEAMKDMFVADVGWDDEKLSKEMAKARDSIRMSYDFRSLPHLQSGWGTAKRKKEGQQEGQGGGQGGGGHGQDSVQGEEEGKRPAKVGRWEHLEPGRGGDAAREWAPLLTGKDETLSLTSPRGEGRTKSGVVKMYSNTKAVGDAARTNGRRPVYWTGGKRPGARGDRSWRDGGENFTALHGNFRAYYGTRRASALGGKGGRTVGKMISPGVWGDPRLDAMLPEWFAGKRCLDVGCNAGLMTLSMAYKFGCRTMEGIDYDAVLVAQARKAKKGIRWTSSAPTAEAMPKVYFRCADVVSDNFGASPPECGNKTGGYDMITCLSVTKWVHLNHGDEGLLRLFRTLRGLLEDGGRLLLEPQSWRSYHRRRGVSNVTRHHYETIAIKPDSFPEVLQEVGFSSVQSIEPAEGLVKGFKRPMYLCTVLGDRTSGTSSANHSIAASINSTIPIEENEGKCDAQDVGNMLLPTPVVQPSSRETTAGGSSPDGATDDDPS